MVKFYLNLSIFTVFLKNKNIILKIRRSKVTDYAALTYDLKRKLKKSKNVHSCRLSLFKERNFFIFRYFSFYEELKFRAQLN